MKKRLTTIREAEQAILFTDSYSRLGAIIDLSDHMRFASWLRLLGKEWSGCDNISEHFDTLYWILGGLSAVRQMMTIQEWRLYESLPPRVTVFRGCGEFNTWGASWSLDRATAAMFPFLNRYKVKKPILVTAVVDKNDILAIKFDRDEKEVITFEVENKNVISVEPLTAGDLALENGGADDEETSSYFDGVADAARSTSAA